MASAWQGTDPVAWAQQSKALLTALVRQSVQQLAVEASTTVDNGGLVPVDTGNLGRSVIVSDRPPQVDAPGTKHDDQRDIAGGLADIELGKPVYIGWTPRYAARVNYGFVGEDSLGRSFNQAGRGFAEAAAAKWPAIVKAEAAKLARR